MELVDINVEVRDVTLARVGVILPTDATFTLQDEFCNVGQWSVTLPLEHPMVPYLRTPGSGLIVTNRTGTVILSGPTSKTSSVGSSEAPEGMVTITGVTDDVILADALAYPFPTSATMAGQSGSARDSRTGPIETLLHAYVNANIGPGAPAARRGKFAKKLVMGTNLGRGASISKSARFDVLGTLLNEIAAVSDIGFRVIQRGSSLVFETFEVADRSRLIRMDLWNNTLAAYSVETAGAALTHAIVGGSEEGVDRNFVERTTPESLSQMDEWGRRIERFLDRRSADTTPELEQAGDEALAKDGIKQALVKFTPMDDSTMRYIYDWFLGDRVTAVVEGVEITALVQSAIIKVDSEGVRLAIALSDSVGTVDQVRDFESRIENRVSSLERTAEGGTTVTNVTNNYGTTIGRQIGEVFAWPSTTIQTGCLVADGSAVSRTTYAALFAVVGTTFGAGNGTTTFNLPNLKGRVPVGQDTAQTEFNALGETGGEKAHLLTAAESGLRDHRHVLRAGMTVGNANTDDGVVRGAASLDANFRTGGVKDLAGTTGSNGYGSADISQPATASHNNLQPYLTLTWLIKAAYTGVEVQGAAHVHATADVTGLDAALTKAPFAEWVGTATCDANGIFSGTFPAGRFTVTPHVVVSVASLTEFAIAAGVATSTTAFSGHCAYFPGGTGTIARTTGFVIAVRAIQRTATSATG